MRHTLLALGALSIAIVTPALAVDHQETHSAKAANPAAEMPAIKPTFDDCFRLAWVRGVHLEQDELPAFTEECLAGKIPFDSGLPGDSIVIGSK